MHEKSGRLCWYAVHVRCGKEHRVAYLLAEKGYECFLPSIRETGATAEPVFPGYVFCRINLGDRSTRVVSTPGVIRILGYGPRPEAIPDAEIEALRRTWEANVRVEPIAYLRSGQRVRITRGALQGIEGLMCEHKAQRRIVLQVALLQRSVALEIDPELAGVIPVMTQHGVLPPAA
ncbi:MAG: hypothetical protein JNL98_04940 [Bryobacterales bacterium]|nr:hypothetical protein [Bryobacterales bacterium]